MNDIVHTWFPVLEFLASVGALALASYVHYVAQSRVTAAEAKLYDRINGQNDRLTRVESAMEHLPQRRDFEATRNQLAEVSGELRALTAELHAVREQLKAQGHSLQRINDHLLDQATKS